MEADAAKSGSARTRSHLALARAAWLIETRKWTDVRKAVDAKGLGDDAAAADLFAIGFASLKTGDGLGAQNALQAMAMLAGDAPLEQARAARRGSAAPRACRAPAAPATRRCRR